MDLITSACLEYLQQLQLGCEQMLKLAMLWDRLHQREARQEILQKLVRRPWGTDVVPHIASMVTWLLASGGEGLQTCRDLFKDPRCGAACEAHVS